MYVAVTMEQSNIDILVEIVDDRIKGVRSGDIVVEDRADHVRELRQIATALRTAEGAFVVG